VEMVWCQVDFLTTPKQISWQIIVCRHIPDKNYFVSNSPTEHYHVLVQFYNFGWEDMTVPTLPYMLDIVKVMMSILCQSNQKVSELHLLTLFKATNTCILL